MTGRINVDWIKDLENRTKEMDIFLFGAGIRAENFLNLLPEKSPLINKIKGIIDNSESKWGQKFLNYYEIYPPHFLEKNALNIFIIITSGHYIEIRNQLLMDYKLNEENIYYSLRYMIDEQYKNWQISDIYHDEIDKLKLNLADEKSRSILENIIANRNNNIFDYSFIKEENQYFPQDIFVFDKNEVFIDGGGYDGDTIEEFINKTTNFNKIYSFEPGKISFNIIDKKFSSDERIVCFNLGLWNKEDKLFFEDNGIDLGNKLSEKGELEIEVNSIDNLLKEKVTFIKLDIEGAEFEALQGAKNIIQKFKPKLAICIYHKYDDLWKIPNYIKELVPEYKLYIRHHSLVNSDTVLYATI